MKGLLVMCSLVLATFVATSFAVRPELDENWESFKATYEKAYEDEDDEALRRDIWEANFDFIQQHNEEYEQGLHTYSVGENEFADMTHEEFLLILLPAVWPAMEPASEASVYQGKADLKDLPDSVDWREKNVVTPVKDQKQCGSCWAFSATGSLEAMHAIATGNLVSLSEQNLVDCSQEEGNMGCSGGFPDWAFEYIIKNNGIDTEDSYPYLAVDGDCKFNPANVGATVKNYTMIQKGSDADLQQVLAEKGPVSCGMDASHFSFQLYKSGVYNEKACSKTMLDHGVLCVGYGDDRGQKYWIVKNSWGTSWGEEGYFQLNRDEPNMCGITTRSSFPIV